MGVATRCTCISRKCMGRGKACSTLSWLWCLYAVLKLGSKLTAHDRKYRLVFMRCVMITELSTRFTLHSQNSELFQPSQNSSQW